MRFDAPRLAAMWLALSLAAMLATGCASNVASASETASERAEARAFAEGVNLRPADLPGFKVVIEGEGNFGPLAHPIEECDGGPRMSGADRGVASPLLQRQRVPVQTVASELYRMASSAIAADYIRAADSDRGLQCIEREEVKKKAAAGLHERVQVAALHPPLGSVGGSGVRVWRCLARSQSCGNAGGFTDRLWFAAGPYVVTLFYIAGTRNEAKGHEPLALPLERRLIALLYSRAESGRPRSKQQVGQLIARTAPPPGEARNFYVAARFATESG